MLTSFPLGALESSMVWPLSTEVGTQVISCESPRPTEPRTCPLLLGVVPRKLRSSAVSSLQQSPSKRYWITHRREFVLDSFLQVFSKSEGRHCVSPSNCVFICPASQSSTIAVSQWQELWPKNSCGPTQFQLFAVQHTKSSVCQYRVQDVCTVIC